MRDLAKKRLAANLRQSVKYLTLVFNDFFVLAIIFMFGALMFWYAQAMKTMPRNLWYYPLLLALILWLPTLSGKLVTLLQDADRQFLLTKDDQMEEYLAPMRRYSMYLPTFLLALTGGVMFPFARIKLGISPLSYLLLLLGLGAGKYFDLLWTSRHFDFDHAITRGLRLARLANLAGLLALLWLGRNFACLLLVGNLLAILLASRGKRQKLFDWQYAIDYERSRKEVVYAAFSMFTDVRERKIQVKRRKYLDFLLPKTCKRETPNSFLYRRTLLRDPEYLNLLVRMTAFAILLTIVVQSPYWVLGLSALVLYLTVWQLLPLGQAYDKNVMYRVYPITREKRGQDLRRVLGGAVFLQAALLAVCWLLLLPEHKFLCALAIMAWAAILAGLYLPYKTAEEDKRARYRGKKRGK